MDIRLSRCFLPIDDHDAAIAFYRDVLGFEIRGDVKYEGMRWTTIGPPSQPDINIILEPPVANPNASPEDKQAIAELMAKGLLGRLDYTVKDVDAAFETVRASGADVLQEPINQRYGVRDCAFRDPAGNEVRFTQS